MADEYAKRLSYSTHHNSRADARVNTTATNTSRKGNAPVKFDRSDFQEK